MLKNLRIKKKIKKVCQIGNFFVKSSCGESETKRLKMNPTAKLKREASDSGEQAGAPGAKTEPGQLEA